MNFSRFEPVYAAIIADFGYDRVADERARNVAVELATPFPFERLDGWAGRTVAVAGAAPCLRDELAVALDADVVLAASTAADVLLDAGVSVDCMVTDLDKNPQTALELTERGVPVAAHAHGDNVPAVREWLPRFDDEWTIATTQVAPRGPVYNTGGFTDGDRAAFLADHLGAGRLVFPGWDFADPTVGPVKARKLAWAARLLGWLERERNERFPVLDGYRDSFEDVGGVGVGRWLEP